MDIKQVLKASAGAFVALFVLDFVTHEVLLKSSYEATAAVWRPMAEMKALMPWMMIAQALFAIGLATFYARGHEAGKPAVAQGASFGAHFGAVWGVAQLGWYPVLSVPLCLPICWGVSTIVNCTVAGIVIAFLYKPSS